MYYAEMPAGQPRASQHAGRMSACGAKAMLRLPHRAGEVFQLSRSQTTNWTIVWKGAILGWMIRSMRGRSVSGDERRWLKVFGTLNEFQARLFAADKALDLGRGGISRLSALTGLSRTTITKATEELQGGRSWCPPERKAG